MRIESGANLTCWRTIATADSQGSNRQDIERLVPNVLTNINWNDQITAGIGERRSRRPRKELMQVRTDECQMWRQAYHVC